MGEGRLLWLVPFNAHFLICSFSELLQCFCFKEYDREQNKSLPSGTDSLVVKTKGTEYNCFNPTIKKSE